MRAAQASSAADLSIPEVLATQVRLHPERPAIIEADRVLSYRHLQQLCLRGAALLRQRWPDRRCIAVLAEQGTDAIVALLTILHAGKMVVILDPNAPAERLRTLVQAAEAAVLVIDPAWISLGELLCDGRSDRVLLSPQAGAAGARLAVAPPPQAPLRIAPDTQACILFSSGTSGQPKGVLATHRTLILAARSYGASAGLSANDRLTLLSSPQYAAGLSAVFAALSHGAALLPFDARARGFSEMRAWMLSAAPTVYHSVPTLFRGFCDSLTADSRFASVRIVKLGGEPVLSHDIRRWRQHFSAHSMFINGLGLSEANGNLCHFKFDAASPIIPALVPVGRPLPAVEILILDADNAVVSDGEVGEIAFRCTHRSPGYWCGGDWSRRLVPSPDGIGAPFFRSGDLGRVLADGNLLHLGRRDSAIKLRGVRIEPAEIEARLLDHPAVAQAAVVMRQDDPASPCLVAYWVPRPAGATAPLPDAGVLRAFLAERLPESLLPRAFVPLDALPVTSNGKLDRRALPSPSLAGDRQRRVAPATDLQKQLHAIWAEVLGHSDFGITDNFFLIGGDSLAAMQVASRIEQMLGSVIAVASLFRHATLAGLASQLEADRSGTDERAQDADIAIAVALELPTPGVGHGPQASSADPA